MFNNMTFNQKKFVSLGLAVAIVAMLSMLTGCSSKAEQEAKKKETTKQVLNPGDKPVRKPGESGFKSF
jgi:hypothetical protein